MTEEPRPLPAVLRKLLEDLPPELRGPIEARLGVVEAHLEKLRPVLVVVEGGLEVARPFLALEEAETQAAFAAAAIATDSASHVHKQLGALAAALDDVREAEASRWSEAVAAVAALDDGDAVDLDRLARVLGVDEVAATEESFDAFMRDDDAPLVLGPRKPNLSAPPTGPRLDRIARRIAGEPSIDLAAHLSRLTVPGALADSPSGLWHAEEDSVEMLLGDGTRLRVVDGLLVRERDEASGERAAPSKLCARRFVGGAPPLLVPGAAAGLANATVCRGSRIEVAPHRVPALLGLGAAIELGDQSAAGLDGIVPRLRALRHSRTDPAAYVALAGDLYRARTWLEPVPDIIADLPVIHVGQIRWCTLTARPLCWMPVFAGDRTVVGGIDRPWTADPPSAGATWEAVAPGVRLDPEWIAPLVVVPGDPNVWAVDPDGTWWSLDVDYDAIVLARRAHREPWLRALEGLHRELADDDQVARPLERAPSIEGGPQRTLPGSRTAIQAQADRVPSGRNAPPAPPTGPTTP